INIATKQGHGSPCSQGASTEICGCNASKVKIGSGCGPELICNILCGDGNTLGARIIISGNGSIAGCVHMPMVE
ncbi:MAG: hypothetical protein ACRCT2_17225, partial [Plesiomonas shigelloides]